MMQSRRWVIAVLLVGVLALCTAYWMAGEKALELPIADESSSVNAVAPNSPPAMATPATVALADPDPLPAAQAPCAIRGLVYTPEGQPAAGATIHCRWSGEERPMPATDGVPGAIEHTTTEEDGTFLLEELPSGRVVLQASHPSGNALKRFRLLPNEPLRSVVLVLRDSGFLAGTVVSRDGTPIKGATVMPLAHNGEEGWMDEVEARAVVTGEGGAFRLEGLATGSWTLHAAAEGFGSLVSPPFETGSSDVRLVLEQAMTLTCRVQEEASGVAVADVSLRMTQPAHELAPTEGVSDGDGTVLFTDLGSGQYRVEVVDRVYAQVGPPTSIELKPMQRPAPVVIRVEAGGEIRGRVASGATGEGVLGLVVEARTSGRARFFSEASDGDGNYQITGLPSGSYRVLPPRFVPGFAQDPSPRLEKTVLVTPGRSIDGVDFTLPSGVALGGTVVDSAGEPVAGALVLARNIDGPKKFPSAHTDGNGRFVFVDFDEGEVVELSAQTAFARSRVYGPYVAGAEGSDTVVISLDRDCGGIIAGRVIDGTGRPFRCKIQAHPEDPALTYPVMPPVAETDSAGNFVLTTACPAVYTLVMVPDSQIRQDFGPVLVPDAGSVTGLTLVYDQGDLLDISGVVVDGEGEAVAGARVHAGESDGLNVMSGTSTRSDETGVFHFSALPEGFYNVRATADGYVLVDDALVEAGATDVVLEMVHAPEISGTVRDGKGNPVEQFTIHLLRTENPDIPPISQTVSDPEGRFFLTAPLRAAWSVRVEAVGYTTTMWDLGLLRLGDVVDEVVLTLERLE